MTAVSESGPTPGCVPIQRSAACRSDTRLSDPIKRPASSMPLLYNSILDDVGFLFLPLAGMTDGGGKEITMRWLSRISAMASLLLVSPAVAEAPTGFRTVPISRLPAQVRKFALSNHAIAARRFIREPGEMPEESLYWLLISQQMVSPNICLRQVVSMWNGEPLSTERNLEMVSTARCQPELDDNGVEVTQRFMPTATEFASLTAFVSAFIHSKGGNLPTSGWMRSGCENATVKAFFDERSTARPGSLPRLTYIGARDGWLWTRKYRLTLDGSFGIDLVKLPGVGMRVVECSPFKN